MTAAAIGARLLVATLAFLALSARASSAADVGPRSAPLEGYVGGKACAACHAAEYAAWQGSHHALAMQEPTTKSVLGRFDGARFTYAGVTSTFSTRDGKFRVTTDGPDGKLTDYAVAYTFGVTPLQQYLLALPGGRLQALGIAWDARPKAAGGQRWFHLHPDERVDFRDVLHWTRPAQNWNHMCAACHSTGVRKKYDAEADRFATTWTELQVSCEACHGPGASHAAWAAKRAEGTAASGGDDLTKGFAARLAPGPTAWTFEADAAIANLTGPRQPNVQVETCGRCHSRATEINEDWRLGQPLAQTHRVALLDADLYEADGQIRDEVYEYGSFLQSRMAARGVVCGDCHDPHSAHLRADGNAVCATCHRASVYDAAAHHHHRGREATRCVACHMPARLYMVVDRRHDHGFRVPRPDLSTTLGTPNACTDCHRDRPSSWAADAVVHWYGATRTRGSSFAGALAAGRRRQANADELLAAAAGTPALPAIVRATAVDLLAGFPDAVQPDLVTRTLREPDPLVRRAALGLLSVVPPERRWQLGAPLLADPMRTVRLDAVSALAETPGSAALDHADRATFAGAVAEYRAAQMLNADRADAWLNLGALDARLGNAAPAEAAYRRAIGREPSFMPSYVNLADLYRALGREAEGERTLRDALQRHAGAADVHYALGLLLVRTHRREDALAELARAATLAPDLPRYAYVYALALDGVGERAKAVAVLTEARRRFTGDRDIAAALAAFSGRGGDPGVAPAPPSASPAPSAR